MKRPYTLWHRPKRPLKSIVMDAFAQLEEMDSKPEPEKQAKDEKSQGTTTGSGQPGKSIEPDPGYKKETLFPPTAAATVAEAEPKKRGRRKKDITRCLQVMSKRHEGLGDVDSLRTSSYREIKRWMCLLLKGKGPPLWIAASEDLKNIWEKMQHLVRKDRDLFKWKGDTTNGSITDGIGRRKKGNLPDPENHSCNTACLKAFFKEPAVREFYSYYTELIFGGYKFDPDSVSKKLKLSFREENPDKVAILTGIKHYMEVTMIKDLHLKPYFEVNPEEIPRNDDLTMGGLINTDFYLA